VPTLSVIVPATDHPATLDRCRAAIDAAADPPEEVIVVDGPSELGAAAARNLGAERAHGDVLLFVDSDVVVHPDAFARARAAFERDADLVAVFGSYDDAPAAPGAVSVFRNLLHHHVHQHAPGPASTFWTGLGAVRADAFRKAGGFDPGQRFMEDVELGMRLAEAGAAIELDPELQCAHLKAWTVRSMVRTDLLGRGVPWTVLLLEHRAVPSELNLGWRHRLSAGSSLGGAAGAVALEPLVVLGAVLAMIALNRDFYRLLVRREGPLPAAAGVGLHMVHHLTAVAALPIGVAAYARAHHAARPRLAPAPTAAPTPAGPDRWLLGSLGVTLLGLAVALTAAVRQDLIFGFGDTPSHVLIPRRVFDNAEPSLAQLGTHWAPLYHVLELPFVWIDPLFRSGASGVIVSIAAALVTCWFVHRLAVLLGASRQRAFVAAALLAVSPSFVYSGVIPMLPATIMAAATANVYFLTRWALTGSGASLVAAGLALSAATLVHFDTWVLGPLEVGVVLVVARSRWRERSAVEATALLWLLAGGYGVALFALMNLLIYGDVLAFVASIGGETAVRPPEGLLAGLLTYPQAAWLNAGPALALAGAVGAGVFAWSRRHEPRTLVALLLFYPVAWYTFQAATHGTYIAPAERLSDWENLRYGTTILPALALFAALGIRGRATLAGVTAAVVVTAGIMVELGRVAAWEDAVGEAPSAIQMRDAGRWVAARTGGDKVLIPAHDALIDRFELESGLPSSAFIDPTDPNLLREARARAHELERMGIGWIVWIGDRDTPEVIRMLVRSDATMCYRRLGGGKARVLAYAVGDSCGRETT
jgi:hypothetical protein